MRRGGKGHFKRLGEGMKQHLKPLFIWATVDNVGVNKVLVDGQVVKNIIPNSLLRKIGEYDTLL